MPWLAPVISAVRPDRSSMVCSSDVSRCRRGCDGHLRRGLLRPEAALVRRAAGGRPLPYDGAVAARVARCEPTNSGHGEGRMRFGVHLAANGPLATPERLAALAERAEALGFDSVWVADHILYPVDFATPYPYGRVGGFSAEWSQYYDPLATLAWLAGLTRRVELGTSVLVVPMRN